MLQKVTKKITKDGGVIIPKQVRELFGWRTGVEVELHIDPRSGSVFIVPKTPKTDSGIDVATRKRVDKNMIEADPDEIIFDADKIREILRQCEKNNRARRGRRTWK